MKSEWRVTLAASKLIWELGKDAPIFALNQAYREGRRGALARQAFWLRIARAIDAQPAASPPPGATIH